MKIDNTELWSGLVGLALSIFVVWAGHAHDLGTINDPGTGYVLFYVGLLMTAFSLVILFSALRNGGPTFVSLWRDVRWTKPLIAIVLLVVFTAAFESLGFLVSTIALLMALLRLIDPVPWWRAIPIAVLSPLICWYVLQKLLLISLPSGIFGLG